MRTALLTAISLSLFSMTSTAQATVNVAIDLAHQSMHVVGNQGTYDWPISSARSGFYTPGGSYAPTHLEVMHYSRKYHMSPMPHAIFFRGGYAIHGTYATGSLGRPASHGCVRLSPGNAATLYAMVRAEGARISIAGAPPASRSFYAKTERNPDRGRAMARVAGQFIGTIAGQDYGDGEAQAIGVRTASRRARDHRPRYADAPAYGFASQGFGGLSGQTPLLPFFGE